MTKDAAMDVLMPQLGETVAEGKIVKWFKSTGDKVAAGDILFEIETDKTSMEVPSIVAGVLAEIRVPVGAVAPVGAVVAVIADTAEKAANPPVARAAPPPMASAFSSAKSADAPTPMPMTPAGMPLPQVAPHRQFAPATAVAAAPAAMTPAAQARPTIALDPFREVRTPERNYGPARLANCATVTPLARRLAVEAGIDLGRVSASGPHGRILARDIGIAAISGGAMRQAPQIARPTPPMPSADRVRGPKGPGPYGGVGSAARRRTMAARRPEAKQTIPHSYLTADFRWMRCSRCASRPTRRSSAIRTAGRPTSSRSTTS